MQTSFLNLWARASKSIPISYTQAAPELCEHQLGTPSFIYPFISDQKTFPLYLDIFPAKYKNERCLLF